MTEQATGHEAPAGSQLSGSADDHAPGSVGPAFVYAMDLFGRRWNGLILRVLCAGELRYSELKQGVGDVSDAVLSLRLAELGRRQLVERRVSDDTPVRVSYRLTEMGQALAPVLDSIAEWADTWVRPEGPRITYDHVASTGRTRLT